MGETGKPEWTRRSFVRVLGGLAATGTVGALRPPAILGMGFPGLRAGRPQESAIRLAGRTVAPVAREPWGVLYRVADGVFAMISDPLYNGDAGHRTVCNGGLIVGSQGTLMIEAFFSHEGAEWVADQAPALGGPRPTHQVITHYHRDHSDGLGAAIGSPAAPAEILSTPTTRELIRAGWEAAESRNGRPLPTPSLPASPATVEIDLGGIVAQLTSRSGHTPSDVTVEVTSPDGERVAFCGDLVWKDMFPNYVDAIPTELARSVAELPEGDDVVYVPGHGELAEAGDVRRYRAVLEDVGEHAMRAAEAGTPAAQAAAAYEIPGELGEWFRFSENYYQRAFEAWYRELGVGA